MVRLLVFLFCLLMSAALWSQDRGLEAVARDWSGSPSLEIGKQYVVLIGIDKYLQWPVLAEAGAEARSLKAVLAAKYYVDEFLELYDSDATAANIRKLFTQTLPAKLGLHDSLLVFFAGHGHLDESKSGFWIPVDGGTDSLTQDRWLPNAQLRNYLGQLKAQRILVLADSCFSGDLLDSDRGASPASDSSYLKRSLQLTCRQVLTSGASETVPDQSEFARELLGYLDRNTDPVVDTYSLYARIRLGMTKTAPLLGNLPGNAAGASYTLFRRSVPVVAGASVTGGAVTGAVVRVISEDPYRAWAVPQTNPGAVPVPVSDLTTLVPGFWVVQAQLPDDPTAVWSRVLEVPDLKEVTLVIPKLSHSRAYRIKALELQKSLLVTQADQDQETSGETKGWGKFFTFVGVVGLIAAGVSVADNHYNLGLMTDDTNQKLRFAGFGAAAVGIPLGLIIGLSNPADADREKLRSTDAQIEKLQAEVAQGLP